MRTMVLLAAALLTACSQAPDAGAKPAALPAVAQARASLSPAAPVNLTYAITASDANSSLEIDVAISTRLQSGTLLIEVAKQEGAALIGAATQTVDLAQAAHPIALQLQASLFGEGEHYLVLLLTVETDMGPMSRSFRVDLTPAPADEAR